MRALYAVHCLVLGREEILGLSIRTEQVLELNIRTEQVLGLCNLAFPFFLFELTTETLLVRLIVWITTTFYFESVAFF